MDDPSESGETVDFSDDQSPSEPLKDSAASPDELANAETLPDARNRARVGNPIDATEATEDFQGERDAPETIIFDASPLSGTTSGEELFDDPKALGEFALVDELGSGSFGAVYRATDVRLDRDVAIKVVKAERAGDPTQREDFLEEARNVAQLRHPNIVPVHQVGELRTGSPFIVYEFIDGPTLHKRKRMQKRFLPYEAVELLTKIAEGLGYAHALGIVHRDVKPANILIEEKTGEPHIADFGCASRLAYREGSKEYTAHTYVGTLAYFSPEQAAGKSHLADARTDVWAIGVMMDEMLSGKRSFHELESTYGGDRSRLPEFLIGIQTHRPLPLRDRVPAVDRDLDAIWAKCLALVPEDRYPNGSELADDFRRWQRNEPVRARPIRLTEQLIRWARRNPQVAGSLATVFGTILFASIVTFILWQKSARDYRRAVAAEVKSLMTADSDSLPDAVSRLRSERLMATEIMRGKWREKKSLLKLASDNAGQIDPLEEETAWRLALGITALEPTVADNKSIPLGQSVGSRPTDTYCIDRLVGGKTDPEELVAACQVLRESIPNLAGIGTMLSQRLVPSEPATQLRALCALATLDRKPDKAAKRASHWLYELESRSRGKGIPWVQCALENFPDLPNQLQELRDSFDESPADREIVNRLLVEVSDHPEDLVHQIAGVDRPLAGILPTLKQRLASRRDLLKFETFVKFAGGEDALNANLAAKLWLAHLYCADVDRDFAELDRHLFRTGCSATIDPSNGQYVATDRTAETQFVCEAFESGIPWTQLMNLAKAWFVSGDGRLAPVLIAMGDFPAPANIAKESSEFLTHIWIYHPDPGVHGACDWLLRKWQISTDPSQLPSTYDARREWRFADGRLYIRIRKPASPFLVGTPEDQLAQFDDSVLDSGFHAFEVAHLQQIVGDFEIAALEISADEVLEFIAAQKPGEKEKKNEWEQRWGETRHKNTRNDVPAEYIAWYDAVEYCTWLSEKETRQSCYGDREKVADAFGKMTIPECDREKDGYRLPTNGEWELACRAGTNSLWPFGTNWEYLEFYANSLNSKSGGKLQPLGLLRPNAWGLFDMLGNVSEFTDSIIIADIPPAAYVLATDKPKREENKTSLSFSYRGGSSTSNSDHARSARRLEEDADVRRAGIGFRVVRSLVKEED